MKLDSKQRPHLAYWDSGLGVLKYATLTEKGWRAQIVDNAGNVGQYPSLALDSQDNVYITYYDASSGSLKLAHKTAEPAPSVPVQKAQAAETPKEQPKE